MLPVNLFLRRVSLYAAFLPLCMASLLSALPLHADENPFKPPRATVHYARNRDYHVRHMVVMLEIFPADHSVQGTVTHYLAPLREGLTEIALDAGSNLRIARCRLGSDECRFTHVGDRLTLFSPAPLVYGKEVAIQIDYGMPGGAKEGGSYGGSFGLSGFHWLDADPQYPERKPGFWTQGETETNRQWVPCYDFPNDKCTSEIVVTVPEKWDVIGNGTQSETAHDVDRHTRTFHWTMKQPHSTYLLSLVGGELDIRTTTWAGIPLTYAVPRGQAELIPASFGNTPDMLQFFSDSFGVKYPWPKYAQSAMLDFGGGMENVSATTLGESSLVDARSGHYAMSSLNSHELAHQWFGDLVTCKDWGDIWLNESFATFCEMFYGEHLDGKDSYDRNRADNLAQYLAEAVRYKRPVSTNLYENGEALFDAHTYPKGGLILHMMRRELGDAGFLRGLKRYLRNNVYQPVDSHDLEKALTEETGINMEPFFAQWIFKPGHPLLDATWTYDAPGKAVSLRIKQLQDTSDGTPIYHAPLTVALLRGSTGGVVERRQITLDRPDEVFRLTASTAPDAVLIDPDHDMLKEVKENHWSDAALPVILRYAPCCLDREAAIPLLTKGENGLNDGTIRQLTEALAAEKEEGVAAAILRRLGDAKRETLRDLFRKEAEAKSTVRRAAAVEVLGKLLPNVQDGRLIHQLATSDTEPYAVVEAALRTMVGESAQANLEVFKHHLSAPSLHNQLAFVALDTVASAIPEIAVPFLVASTGVAYNTHIRIHAAEKLSAVPAGNRAAHLALLNLLNAQDTPDLQIAAIRTLQERKEKAAVPSLRALAVSAKKKEVQSLAKQAADALDASKAAPQEGVH